jgi:hypothetical protein
MTGADAGMMDSKIRPSAVASNAAARIRFHTMSVVIFVAFEAILARPENLTAVNLTMLI